MAWDPTNSRWFLLAGAALLLYNAIRGVITGRAILFIRDVTRDDGYLFWWAVLMSAIFAVAVVVILILGK